MAVPASAEGDAQGNLQQWQLRRLQQPTDRERMQELSGGVYIYDGLTDKQVDQALDRHFNRIESMMFMGTIKTDPEGKALRDEEGKALAESPNCR